MLIASFRIMRAGRLRMHAEINKLPIPIFSIKYNY